MSTRLRLASSRAAAAILALGFLLLHLPFLPASLEDLDSINFALGLRQFDPTLHQPHPPGYPLYILAGKAVRLLASSEVSALSLLGILSGSVAAFFLIRFVAQLDPAGIAEGRPFQTTLLTMTAPLFWFTAARPLSDIFGLAAAIGIQALTLSAETNSQLIAASFLAALATGIRSQVAWLTVPLLVFAIARRPQADRQILWRQASIAVVVGGLLWFLPLVWLSHGPAAYWNALWNQGDEDLTGVVMLWTTPTPRQLLNALNSALVAPWAIPQIAGLVIPLAAVGLVGLLRSSRTVLVTLLMAFGPYFIFDLLFQETATTRYAVPLVLPMAYLAVRGIEVVSGFAIRMVWRGPIREADLRPSRMAFAIGLAGVGLAVGGSSLYAYARAESPTFRMLTDMRAAAAQASPVVAMHRRAEFDLRRPVAWAGTDLSVFAQRLPSPPKHEWRELVRYWNAGGRDPVWFVADPLRSDLALVDDPLRRASYRWPHPPVWPTALSVLLGGVRPNEMDWYVIDPPGWYAGEGWSLTPETAGVAGEDKKGPGLAPIQAWIRRRPEAATMMIGGRQLAQTGEPAHVRAEVDGRVLDEWDAPPGFFLRMVPMPAGSLTGDGDYAALTVQASTEQVAIEQFDVESNSDVMFGFSDGWHEQEYDARLGRTWRWTSEKAVVRVRAAGQPLALRVTGVAEAAPSARVIVRAGERTIVDQTIGRDFSFSAALPADVFDADEGTITIETDQTYVPAERSARVADRRRLGLKIYEWQLGPASEPGTAESSRPGY